MSNEYDFVVVTVQVINFEAFELFRFKSWGSFRKKENEEGLKYSQTDEA